jgi:hypothetical protein
VVLMKGRETWARVIPHLILLLLPPLRSGHHGICAGLVCWVVQEGTNIVHKQRVEGFSDPLLVGKFERALKWNPVPFSSVQGKNRGNLSYSPDAL